MSEKEDDTKSMMGLVGLYQITLTYTGILKEEFDARWKSFQVSYDVLSFTGDLEFLDLHPNATFPRHILDLRLTLMLNEIF